MGGEVLQYEEKVAENFEVLLSQHSFKITFKEEDEEEINIPTIPISESESESELESLYFRKSRLVYEHISSLPMILEKKKREGIDYMYEITPKSRKAKNR